MRLSWMGLALTAAVCAAPFAARAQAPITIYCSILEEQCRVGVAAFEKATGAKATRKSGRKPPTRAPISGGADRAIPTSRRPRKG